MNADTITTARLADLEALLDFSLQTAYRLRINAEAGDIDPAEAAAIIRETVKTINDFCDQ